MRVLILGSGVIGTVSAYYLARAGFELGQVPLAAIEAGGGSLRCCVAEVF